MRRRRSQPDREKMHAEQLAYLGKEKEDDPTPPKVNKRLSCGHEEYVHAGVDPETSICWVCHLNKQRRV